MCTPLWNVADPDDDYDEEEEIFEGEEPIADDGWQPKEEDDEWDEEDDLENL